MQSSIFFSIILLSLLRASPSLAFFDSIFQKASGAAAVATGAEDLIESIDDNSRLLEDLDKMKETTSEVRDLLSDADAIYYDAEYILGEVNQINDLTNTMHMAASKTRRAKRLAKTLGIIATDASAASAMESARSNLLLEDLKLIQKEEIANNKVRRYKAASYIANRQRAASITSERSLSRMTKAEPRSGIAFHPFTMPNTTAAAQERLVEQIMGVQQRQTSLLSLGN